MNGWTCNNYEAVTCKRENANYKVTWTINGWDGRPEYEEKFFATKKEAEKFVEINRNYNNIWITEIH